MIKDTLADAPILANLAHGTLLVVEAGEKSGALSLVRFGRNQHGPDKAVFRLQELAQARDRFRLRGVVLAEVAAL